LQVIIKGVRSICDELLGDQDPIKIVPDPPGGTATTTSMPGAGGAAAPGADDAADDTEETDQEAKNLTGAGAPDPVVANPAAGYVGPEGSVELDPEGIPWDARIHTVKKAKLTSGVWRIKPKSDPTVVAQVKTELAKKVADYQAGKTLANETEKVAPAAPATDAGAGAGGETITQGAGGVLTWAVLLNKIVAAGIPGDTVVDTCVACGVPNFAALQKEPQETLDAVAMALGV
jgi:hypothetical protein